MRVRNLLILLLVVIIIASCTFVVVNGVSFGVKEFQPLRAINRGLDLTGGVYIVYQADDPTIDDLDTKIQGAMEIFRTRLDDKGFTEATITRQGTDRIRVEVPINETSSVQDPNEIVDFIGTPAKLQFTYNDGTVIVEGEDIISATPMVDDTGKYIVSIKMNDSAAKDFAKATQELYNSGETFKITLDGKDISTPTVNSVIPNGEGYIEGNFTEEYARELAMQIESGALPLELTAIEQRSQSATLGAEALEKGIFAGVLGLAILMVFMIAVYRLPGFMADIALVAYIAIVLFVLALFQVQLTLPGIAGIILGVGMAVDANVVIFARFKEEYWAGKSLRASLKTGFSKAAKAITDSNITTLIAAVVLALFGTGSIKGFAYTLIISILISLLSALVITQLLLKLVIGIAPKCEGLYMPRKKEKKEAVDNAG